MWPGQMFFLSFFVAILQCSALGLGGYTNCIAVFIFELECMELI
jgi:hypothetical protein